MKPIPSRKKNRLRILSAIVLFIYAAQDISWAEGIGHVTQFLPRPPSADLTDQKLPSGVSLPLALRLSIPDNYGTIKDRHAGSKTETFVIIQDAHATESAQRSVSSILSYLHDHHQLKDVAVEGREGRLLTEYFSFFPDLEVRRNVSELLLKKGRLSGAEYAAVVLRKDLRLFGVEDKQIYQDNLTAYLEARAAAGKSLKDLESLDAASKLIAGVLIKGELGQYIRSREAFEKNGTDFISYARFLKSKEDPAIDFSEKYPHTAGFLKAADLEKKIDMEAAASDMKQFLKELGTALSKEELEKFWSQMIRLRSGLIGRQEFYGLLLTLSGRHGLSVKYAGLARYFEYVLLYEKASVNLIPELKALETSVEARLAAGSDEELLAALKVLAVFRKLLDLSLDKDDAVFYFENRKKFDFEKIKKILDARIVLARASEPILLDSKGLSAGLLHFERFYQTAIRRDKVLAEKAVLLAEKSGGNLTAVVAGGFHTPGLARYLREQGYSYLVVTPRIGQIEDEGSHSSYHEALIRSPLPLEELYFQDLQKKNEQPLNSRYQLAPRLLIPVQTAGETPLFFLDDRDESLALLYFVWLFNLTVFLRKGRPLSVLEANLPREAAGDGKNRLLEKLRILDVLALREEKPARGMKTGPRILYRPEDETLKTFTVIENGNGKAFVRRRLNLQRAGNYDELKMGSDDYVIVRGVPEHLIPDDVAGEIKTARSELRGGLRRRDLSTVPAIESLELRNVMSSAAVAGVIWSGTKVDHFAQPQPDHAQIDRVMESLYSDANPSNIPALHNLAIPLDTPGELWENYGAGGEAWDKVSLAPRAAALQAPDLSNLAAESRSIISQLPANREYHSLTVLNESSSHLTIVETYAGIDSSGHSAVYEQVSEYLFDKQGNLAQSTVILEENGRRIYEESLQYFYEGGHISSFTGRRVSDEGSRIIFGVYTYAAEGHPASLVIRSWDGVDPNQLHRIDQIVLFEVVKNGQGRPVELIERIYNPRSVGNGIVLSPDEVIRRGLPADETQRSELPDDTVPAKITAKLPPGTFPNSSEIIRYDANGKPIQKIHVIYKTVYKEESKDSSSSSGSGSNNNTRPQTISAPSGGGGSAPRASTGGGSGSNGGGGGKSAEKPENPKIGSPSTGGLWFVRPGDLPYGESKPFEGEQDVVPRDPEKDKKVEEGERDGLTEEERQRIKRMLEEAERAEREAQGKDDEAERKLKEAEQKLKEQKEKEKPKEGARVLPSPQSASASDAFSWFSSAGGGSFMRAGILGYAFFGFAVFMTSTFRFLSGTSGRPEGSKKTYPSPRKSGENDEDRSLSGIETLFPPVQSYSDPVPLTAAPEPEGELVDVFSALSDLGADVEEDFEAAFGRLEEGAEITFQFAGVRIDAQQNLRGLGESVRDVILQSSSPGAILDTGKLTELITSYERILVGLEQESLRARAWLGDSYEDEGAFSEYADRILKEVMAAHEELTSGVSSAVSLRFRQVLEELGNAVYRLRNAKDDESLDTERNRRRELQDQAASLYTLLQADMQAHRSELRDENLEDLSADLEEEFNSAFRRLDNLFEIQSRLSSISMSYSSSLRSVAARLQEIEAENITDLGILMEAVTPVRTNFQEAAALFRDSIAQAKQDWKEGMYEGITSEDLTGIEAGIIHNLKPVIEDAKGVLKTVLKPASTGKKAKRGDDKAPAPAADLKATEIVAPIDPAEERRVETPGERESEVLPETRDETAQSLAPAAVEATGVSSPMPAAPRERPRPATPEKRFFLKYFLTPVLILLMAAAGIYYSGEKALSALRSFWGTGNAPAAARIDKEAKAPPAADLMDLFPLQADKAFLAAEAPELKKEGVVTTRPFRGGRNGEVGISLYAQLEGELVESESIRKARGSGQTMVYVKKGEVVGTISTPLLDSEIARREEDLDKLLINYGRLTGVLNSDIMSPEQKTRIRGWVINPATRDYVRRMEPLLEMRDFEIPIYVRLLDLVYLKHKKTVLGSVRSPVEGHIYLTRQKTAVTAGSVVFNVRATNIFSFDVKVPNADYTVDFDVFAKKGDALQRMRIWGIDVNEIIPGSSGWRLMTVHVQTSKDMGDWPETVYYKRKDHPSYEGHGFTFDIADGNIQTRVDGVVGPREIVHSGGANIPGILQMKRGEMTYVSNGEAIAEIDGTDDFGRLYHGMANFLHRAYQVIDYNTVDSIAAGHRRYIPAYYGVGDASLLSLNTIYVNARKLDDIQKMRAVKAGSDGLVRRSFDYNGQPVLPNSPLFEIVPFSVPIMKTRVPKSTIIGQNQLVIVKIENPPGSTQPYALYIAEVTDIQMNIPQSDGKNWSDYKELNLVVPWDVLFEFDRRGLNAPVQVVVPKPQDQKVLQAELTKVSGLARQKAASGDLGQYPVRHLHTSPVPQLIQSVALEETGSGKADPNLGRADVLPGAPRPAAPTIAQKVTARILSSDNKQLRIDAAKYFIKYLRDEDFDKHLEKLMLEGHPEEAELALNYYRDNEDAVRLGWIYKKAYEAKGPAHFTTSLSFAHLRELFERPGRGGADPVYLFLQESAKNADFAPFTNRFFLSIIMHYGGNHPVSRRILESDAWTDVRLAQYAEAYKHPLATVLKADGMRRIAASKAPHYHPGYLRVFKSPVSTFVYPWMWDRVSTMERNNLQDQQYMAQSPMWLEMAAYETGGPAASPSVNGNLVGRTLEDYERVKGNGSGRPDTPALFDLPAAEGNNRMPLYEALGDEAKLDEIQAMYARGQHYDLARLIKTETVQRDVNKSKAIFDLLVQDPLGRILLAQQYLRSADEPFLKMADTSSFANRIMEDSVAFHLGKNTSLPPSFAFYVYQDTLGKIYQRSSSANKIVYVRAIMAVTVRSDFELTALIQGDENSLLWKRLARWIDGDTIRRAAREESERRAWIFAISLAREKYGITSLGEYIPDFTETDYKNIEQNLNFRFYDSQALKQTLRLAAERGNLNEKHYNYILGQQKKRSSDIETGRRENISDWTALFYIGGAMLGLFLLLGIYYAGVSIGRRYKTWRIYWRIMKEEQPISELVSEVNDYRELEEIENPDRQNIFRDTDVKDTFDEWFEILRKTEFERGDYFKILKFAKKVSLENKFRYNKTYLEDPKSWDVTSLYPLMNIYTHLILFSQKRIYHELSALMDSGFGEGAVWTDDMDFQARELLKHARELDAKGVYAAQFRRIISLVNGMRVNQGYNATRWRQSKIISTFSWATGAFLNGLAIAGWVVIVRPFLLLSPTFFYARLQLRKSMAVFEKTAARMEPGLTERDIAGHAYSESRKSFINRGFKRDAFVMTAVMEIRRLFSRLLTLSSIFLPAIMLLLDVFTPLQINIWVYIISFAFTLRGYIVHIHPMIVGWHTPHFADQLAVLNALRSRFRRAAEVLPDNGRYRPDFSNDAHETFPELEQEMTFEAGKKELDPAQAPSVDAIVINYGSNENPAVEEKLKEHLRGHVRADIPILFVRNEFSGSGAAFLEGRGRLKEQWAAAKATGRFPHMPAHMHRSRVLHVLAGGSRSDALSFAQGVDFRYLPLDLNGRPISTLVNNVYNGYKVAQSMKKNKMAGEIIMHSDNAITGPMVPKKGITMIGSYASIEDTVEQGLGVFFNPYDEKVRILREKPDEEDIKKIVNADPQKLGKYVDVDNKTVRQLNAFTGAVIISFDDDLSKYRHFEGLLDKIMTEARKSARKENYKPDISLPRDLIIPLMLSKTITKLDKYTASRISGVPKKGKKFYRQLAGIFKKAVLLSADDVSVFTPPNSQSFFMDLRDLDVYIRLLKEGFIPPHLRNEAAIESHGKLTLDEANGNLIYNMRLDPKATSLENVFFARIPFLVEGSAKEIFYAMNLDENPFTENILFGQEGGRLLRRFVDRRLRPIFPDSMTDIRDAPIFPPDFLQLEGWAALVPLAGTIPLEAENAAELEARGWRSINWMLEHQKDLLIGDSARSELRAAAFTAQTVLSPEEEAAVVKGLEEADHMKARERTIAGLPENPEAVSALVRQALEDHFRENLPFSGTPASAESPRMLLIEYNGEIHTPEFVRNVSRNLAGFAKVIVIPSKAVKPEDIERLRQTLAEKLRQEIASGAIYLARFRSGDWNAEKYAGHLMKKHSLEAADVLFIEENGTIMPGAYKETLYSEAVRLSNSSLIVAGEPRGDRQISKTLNLGEFFEAMKRIAQSA